MSPGDGKGGPGPGTYGSWCMVVGAAEGLGRAFAETAARRGTGVILVDRNLEALEKLSVLIQQEYRVPARTLHLDLASDGAVSLLMKEVKETGCRFLIYNAAFSRVQPFLKNTPEELETYIRVNAKTPLELVHAFASHHRGQPSQRKGILLMSSLAGSWGNALLAPYGATKAFNHILAEGLYHELGKDGFDILACIIGATATPGYLGSEPDDRGPFMKVMQPGPVAEECMNALGKRPYVVPGRSNRFKYVLLSRVFPRRLSLRLMNRTVTRLYHQRL